MNRKQCLITFMVAIAFAGCYYDKEEMLYPATAINCSSVNATFTSVKPIIAANCTFAGCHNTGSAAGGTVLENYEQIKAKAARINQRTIVDKTMPVGSQLNVNELAIIKCWIDSGSPNN